MLKKQWDEQNFGRKRLKAKKEKNRWLLYTRMMVSFIYTNKYLTVLDVEVLFMHDKGLVSD